jgi:hypothetical protein
VAEGNGHVIDPDGEARRALQAAVAGHGPQALSNAVIMDAICQDRLADLPGEAVLIGSAARSDVPALLRELIPRMGNYGAIQSAAATLAEAHGLDNAACLWVVREFARALGLIAPGGIQPTARIGATDPGAETGAGAGAGAGAGPGSAGGSPPRRPPSSARVLNRNTVGIAAAIALVAGYLGVAAVAHLSPFPARTVAATSPPPPASGGATTSPSQAGSPDPSPDPTPPSDYQILLTKIPGNIKGSDNCHNIGTSAGATAVSQCTAPRGLAAGTLIYYLYPSRTALSSGFGNFLTAVKFRKQTECTTDGDFVNFTVECESNFTSTSPSMAGLIAEYANQSNNPIIVTSDNQQQVMAVLVGTNDGDLLTYWKQLQWVVTT